jgi:hypothetical protein
LRLPSDVVLCRACEDIALDSSTIVSGYEDISPWAVHFTSPSLPRPLEPPPPGSEKGISRAQLLHHIREIQAQDKTGYSNIMSILWEGRIEPFAEPHGAGKDVPEVADAHRSAALSEIPLHLLDRLVKHRSLYGIGFSQDFLVTRGGARVWYIEASGAPAQAIHRQVEHRVREGVDPADPFWQVTPFIEFPDPSQPFADWRWEREWRVPGGLRFKPSDVAFLFIPEALHDKARHFFADHHVANTGPAYLCPYVDATWDRERIQAQLETTQQAA